MVIRPGFFLNQGTCVARGDKKAILRISLFGGQIESRKLQVEISGIRISVTEEIDNYIKKKLDKLNKYFRQVPSARVILKAEKERYFTEISLTADGVTIRGNGMNSDLYNSIEVAIGKIKRQARKHKEKLKSHRPRNVLEKTILDSSSVTSADTEHNIIYITKEIAKPMTVEEAVMQLETEGNKFFVFLNSSTSQVNVVYKRENGSFVLIEPQV